MLHRVLQDAHEFFLYEGENVLALYSSSVDEPALLTGVRAMPHLAADYLQGR